MKIILLINFFVLSVISSYSQSQYQMNEDSFNKYKKADAELNIAYKQLSSYMKDQKEKTLLIKAEKAWISYRDAHCNYTESFYEGGSMQQSVYFDCLRIVTEERTKELRNALRERMFK